MKLIVESGQASICLINFLLRMLWNNDAIHQQFSTFL